MVEQDIFQIGLPNLYIILIGDRGTQVHNNLKRKKVYIRHG